MRRHLAPLAALLIVLVAACGSGDDPTLDVDEPSETTTTTAPSDGDGAGALSAEEAEVAAAWEAFFDPGNPVEQTARYLEGGLDMREAIEAGAASETRVGAVVTDVRIVGDVAEVTYTLTNAETGDDLLPGAGGVAVRVDGEWKVSNGTFCTLLSLGGIETDACAGQIEPDVPATG